MNIPVIFQFLKEVSANNNREWFNAHKDLYEEARGEFENLLSAIITRISLFDESIRGVQVKDCTYRIYRDTRFSQDKTPYKTHLGGYIRCPACTKRESMFTPVISVSVLPIICIGCIAFSNSLNTIPYI